MSNPIANKNRRYSHFIRLSIIAELLSLRMVIREPTKIDAGFEI
jgi:hypothetical protein